MVKAVATLRRRVGQVGIVPRLLTASLLMVAIAVLALQVWTLHIVEMSGTQAAQVHLDGNLAVLKEMLRQRGANWRLGADGQLTVDGKPAVNLQQVVEDASRITGGVAALFASDTRVATSVKGPDASTAIGTKLVGAAHEAVIGLGNTYRSVSDILGVPHFTIHEPLHDAAGRPIGILFVALPRSDVQAMLDAIVAQGWIAGLTVIVVFCTIGWLMLRATMRPLQALAGSVHSISDGQLNIFVPCVDRTDQLGEIGRAVEMLRTKAQRAQSLEQDLLASARREATALRESNAQLGEMNAKLETGRLQFHAVLDSMSQGLTFFDGEQKLVVCNRRYTEIYRLSAGQTRVGTSLSDILGYRMANGSFPAMSRAEYIARRDDLAREGTAFNVADEMGDGRIISMYSQPLPNSGWVSTHEDITGRRRDEAELVFMARHDALTKLPNRTLFRERLEQATAMARRGIECALLCLDLDRFKTINDTLGHPIGDKLLRAVAVRLVGAVREVDTVARLGGDEFAVIQVGLSLPEHAAILADRIIKVIQEPFDIDGNQVEIGMSIGISIANGAADTPETLLTHADVALYLAKAEGRGVYRFFEPEMDLCAQEHYAFEKPLPRQWVGERLPT